MYVNQMHPKPLILMRDAIINICQLVCWLHEHVSSSPGEEYHTDFCKEKNSEAFRRGRCIMSSLTRTRFASLSTKSRPTSAVTSVSAHLFLLSFLFQEALSLQTSNLPPSSFPLYSSDSACPPDGSFYLTEEGRADTQIKWGR